MIATHPVAVVTGAASGIGRAVTVRLLAEQVHVIAVDRDEAGLGSLGDPMVEPFVADLSSTDGRDKLVARATHIDFLVNAAGIMVAKPILDVSIADLRGVLAINVEAVWDLTSRIGRVMPDGGAIVNLSSTSAKLAATVEIAAYALSKAAVLSLTRSFAAAFASRGVRINAICPGNIETPMQTELTGRLAAIRGSSLDDVLEARLRPIPLARMGSPEECAALVWFLLSGESSYMTGQSINISGGWVTW